MAFRWRIYYSLHVATKYVSSVCLHLLTWVKLETRSFPPIMPCIVSRGNAYGDSISRSDSARRRLFSRKLVAGSRAILRSSAQIQWLNECILFMSCLCSRWFSRPVLQVTTLEPSQLNNTRKARQEILFFNRVPKVGSQTFMELLRRLSIANEFGFHQDHVQRVETVRMAPDDQAAMASMVSSYEAPSVYIKHVCFTNFSESVTSFVLWSSFYRIVCNL